jgi:hypothetical protein
MIMSQNLAQGGSWQSHTFRNNVAALEEILKAGGNHDGITIMPVDGIETLHHFIPGVYIREVRIPKGMIVTGRIHKTEHFCIVVGDVEISCEDSHKRYGGYNTFKSQPGVKRALFTFEDTIFSTVHRTDETDTEKLMSLMTAETYEEFERLPYDGEREVLP